MSSTSHSQIKTEEMRYDERNLIPSMEVDPCIMASRGKRVEVKKLGKLPQMLRVERAKWILRGETKTRKFSLLK